MEEYEVPAESFILGGLERDQVIRFTVIARCSHGRGFKPGTIREQKSHIDVPEWWGVAHIDDAIRTLIFFAPGVGDPAHNLVTRIH